MKKEKVNHRSVMYSTKAFTKFLFNGNLNKILIAFILFCSIINNMQSQCTSCTYNMSFERAAGGCFGQSFAPNTNICVPDAINETWSQCGTPYIPTSWGCGSADIGPGGSINATNKPPTHGSSFLSMECGPAGEGVDMALCAGGNLVAGTTYCFAIDINCKGTTGNITIYGSMGLCGATEALWVSPDHSGDNWVTNNFCITPTGNWTHLQFRNTKGSGFYAISIDNWRSTDGKFPPVSGTPPTVTVPSATICNGNSTTLTASGATTYTWSPATGLSATTGTSVTANPSTTTTYTIVGTTSGCTGSATAVVTVNPNPTVSVPPATVCPGNSTNLTASGATNYTWSPATGLSATTGSSVTANPSTTTTYTVIGSHPTGCTASGTVVVTVSPPCGPTITTTGATICNGSCGTLTSTATGGLPPYNYSWNTGGTTSSIVACPVTTTTYTLTVTDNSVPVGTATAIAVITVNPNPTVSVPDATICSGNSTSLTASGATTYNWLPTTGLSSSVGTTVTANPTTTTTYTVTGAFATGCTASTTVVVTVNSVPVVSVPNASICPGGSTTLTASGASTYTWTTATGLSATTGTTVTANPATNTTYTVIGTSAGCSASTTVTVSVGALVATTSPNTTICFGESTNLSAAGGSTFSWTPATGLSNPNIANPVANPTVTTTYTVIVSDVSCSDDAVVVVTVNPAISLNVAPLDVTCFGACNGQTFVIPSGGSSPFTYSWSGGCTTAACNNVCAGTYTLTATDAAGCTASGSAIVSEPAALTVVLTGQSNVSCFGLCDGTAGVSASGGTATYNYSWTPNGAITPNASGLCANTYTCTVTDANNCTVNTSVVITEPTAIILSSSNTTICPNTCATLTVGASGGNGAIGFSWNLGVTTASVSVCPASTTTYTVVGTDNNGCSADTSIVVTVEPTPVISIPASSICQGTSTVLSASGANNYTWTPTASLSSGNGTSVTANPNITTTYTVIGTSTTGCTNSTTVIVTVNASPVITPNNPSICPKDSVLLTANGASTYIWSPAEGISTTTGGTVTASPTTTSSYVITGTGTNGCTSSTTVVVTVHPKPTADFTTSPNDADEFNPTVYFYDNSTGGTINSWIWNFGDSVNTTSLVQNPMFTYPPVSNTYIVRLIVTNQFGCIDTTQEVVYIRGIFTFYIPNTFTPNNDGQNDGFYPKGVGIDETDYELWIYDRWGNMIWHTNIWGEAWDGKANKGSDIAQIDTYVWKVHVREAETGLKHNYIGHVNIIK